VKITDLQIDGFGVWKGLTVESLSDQVTVFYGQNEAGKTTLMHFARSLCFGFSKERIEKYTPPVYGGLAGGSMYVESPRGGFEIQRHVDPNRHMDIIGDLAVTDNHDGTVHGATMLNTIMCEVDEPIFNNVFAVGLREIQELGALNSTDAAESLYKLTSGLDRVSLVDVMRNLRTQRDDIWSNDPESKARLSTLFEKRRKLMQEIEELRTRSKRWSRISAQTQDINHRLEELTDEIKATEREARLVEVSIQIADRWKSRDVLTQQVEAFGRLPEPQMVQVKELDKINAKVAQQRERINEIKSERLRVKAEGTRLPINRTLWSQKSRIQAVSEHLPWIESLMRQATHLKTEINTIENGMVEEVDGLGNQLKIRAKDVRDLSNRGLTSLKANAKTLLEHEERLNLLKQEADKAKFELGQTEEHLGTSISEHSDGIPNSLDETSRHVNRLRRRIELEEKIQKLQNSRHVLEREVDDVVNEQVLPVSKLSVIGLVFVVGTILAGFGLIGSLFNDMFLGGSEGFDSFGQGTSHLGFLLMLLGAVFFFVALGLKYHWERIARDELEDYRHQIELIRQQLKRAKNERDEIERQLPETLVSGWDLELKDAESRMNRLEELAPMETRVKSARMNLEDLRHRIKSQEREVTTKQETWRATLRSVGLPESLSPLQVKEITERSSRIATNHARIDQYKVELADRNRELSALTNRINELVTDSGMSIQARNPLERLTKLNNVLGEQRQLVATRREYIDRYKNLRNRFTKAKRELDRLNGLRHRMLSNVGVETEDEYRQFDIKHAQRRKLISQRHQLTEQIAAALGTNFAEDDIENHLETYGKSGLEKRWEDIQLEVETLKEQQTKLLQQRGEFLQEVKMLGEDSRLDEARLELNVIDAEMYELKKRWQVLATSAQMLETIREGYEAKRQPETLQEASTYLERLTDGQYVRIWTKLVGEELLVDNANDETITVDKLSRGTREAVYLSLRLALIGAYARRGTVLPMVLDDVLVNFDAHRARKAAELLCDFSAKGYQLLFFTCHDHMRDMFHNLGADVRILPHHRDVVEHQAMPYPYRGSTEPVYQPAQIVEAPAMVTQVSHDSIELTTNEYDPELEFELSAVTDAQQIESRLRNELVYISPNVEAPIDLSGNEDIWFESNQNFVRRD
jgi:uncharacterized protein YhaN